jgi:hypothetical protein
MGLTTDLIEWVCHCNSNLDFELRPPTSFPIVGSLSLSLSLSLFLTLSPSVLIYSETYSLYVFIMIVAMVKVNELVEWKWPSTRAPCP